MSHAIPLLMTCIVLLTACTDRGAETAANQVQEGLQAAQETESQTAATTPQRDTAQERRCANITQSAMERIEERMRTMDRELVVLSGDDQLVLSCSRYRKYLRGEVSSY